MVVIDQALMSYVVFAMVLVRCSGLAVFAPFFGSNNFPARVRIWLVVFMGMVVYPAAIKELSIPDVIGMPELAILALQELCVGLVIGFLSSFIFMSAQLSGQLIGQQIGFAMANVVDPLSDTQVSIIGFMKMNLAMLIFLILNLHLLILLVLWNSYDYVGIGELAFTKAVGPLNDAAVYHATSLYIVALKLATPVLLVMLLNNVTEGFVTRTMPQLNIMVLGLPMRVALGLLTMMVILPSMLEVVGEMMKHMVMDLDRAMYALKI